MKYFGALVILAIAGCGDTGGAPDASVPYCTAAVQGTSCAPEGGTCSDQVFEGVNCSCVAAHWQCHRGGVPMNCSSARNGDVCDPLASCGSTRYPSGCFCNAQTDLISGCIVVDMAIHD